MPKAVKIVEQCKGYSSRYITVTLQIFHDAIYHF